MKKILLLAVLLTSLLQGMADYSIENGYTMLSKYENIRNIERARSSMNQWNE